MDKQQVQEWLDRYGVAWVKGDPEKIVALFSDNATYQETPFDAPMKGRQAIRQYWQSGAADAQEDVEFSSQVWAVDEGVAIAAWQAKFTRKSSGIRVELDGIFRITLSQGPNGPVCDSLQEWWHRRET